MCGVVDAADNVVSFTAITTDTMVQGLGCVGLDDGTGIFTVDHGMICGSIKVSIPSISVASSFASKSSVLRSRMPDMKLCVDGPVCNRDDSGIDRIRDMVWPTDASTSEDISTGTDGKRRKFDPLEFIKVDPNGSRHDTNQELLSSDLLWSDV